MLLLLYMFSIYPIVRLRLQRAILMWGLLCCIASFASPVMAQDSAKINILHADMTRIGVVQRINKLIGNVRLEHKDMQMTCDSLYQYPDSNYVEAFGRVHAIQSDTLHLWGDYMTYNSKTLLAQVRHNVSMNDQKITLTTNFLDYNAATRVGYYFNHGTIKDKVNTLSSKFGYYYVPINEMFFKDSVQVHTPDYRMFSDTMKYQTVTKIITILGPTHIHGDNRTLYSEKGWYNSLTSHAELYKNNHLTYNEYLGVADTIIVDSISGSAIMKQHIHLYDTVNNVIVEGHYGKVLKNNDYAYITQRALLTIVGEADSLFIHGDTISVNKDTLGSNVMKAYYNTKLYNTDLQGICDSMVFPVADSTVYLYHTPIVWASGNQMTATDINMHMKGNNVDLFHLNNKAMIINQADTNRFNQIKGRNITGYVENNELRMVYVNGSSETLYYLDEKGTIIGLFKATSPNTRILIEKKQIEIITFLNKTDGTITPIFMVKPEDQQLKDFQWHIEKKPTKKEDIFHSSPSK